MKLMVSPIRVGENCSDCRELESRNLRCGAVVEGRSLGVFEKGDFGIYTLL